MRKLAHIMYIFSILVFCSFALSQFLPSELRNRDKQEKFLKKATIEKFEEIGEGITKPLKLYLKLEDEELCGCWKDPKGIQKGFLEGWRYEIAAYKMDKLLEINMVPPTVERKFQGKKGSLQLWVDYEYSLLDIVKQKVDIPASEYDHVNKVKYLARAFDSLIANEDRTQQNILYTKDWRMILIDHSRAFRSSKEFTEKLIYGKNAKGRPMLFRQLPHAFVEKVKGMDLKTIRNAVGPYLKKVEIDAILIRKKLLLEEIEELIKMNGVDKVLY
ncbi:hypothetical protein ACFLRM_06340 [Acidobacteriota bacterium]